MLGWMMKRGKVATDVDAEGGKTENLMGYSRLGAEVKLTLRNRIDTTQIDQPDTPAPVFAARALKRAVFGTPDPGTDEGPQNHRRATEHQAKPTLDVADTPSKPLGILLTPGTGAARRKKVSFGHEVGSKAKIGEGARRTRRQDTLKKATRPGDKLLAKATQAEDCSESEWEEADDDDFCSHDITIDHNEPHAHSGRYWKEEQQKYQVDAKAKMDKLLQYKKVAKSYALQKDSEAIQLAEMLRVEQQKVASMERKIAENTSQIASTQQHKSSEIPPEVLSKLAKQTALAVQYRQRSQELEVKLKGVLLDKKDDADTKAQQRHQTASPKTRSTLVETQRELRRARAQVKELGELREEVKSLKAQMREAEKKARNSQPTEATSDNKRSRELRDQLRQANEQFKLKNDELNLLRGEFEAFRQESQAHDEDTKAVLERAHSKIAELKKEAKTLKATRAQQPQPESWQPGVQFDEPIADSRIEGDQRAGKVRTPSRSSAPSFTKRRIDRIDTDENDAGFDDISKLNMRTLLEKYSNDEVPAIRSAVLTNLPNLGKPRWQPFVPRSPRNRGDLGDRLESKIANGGTTPAFVKDTKLSLSDLSALAKSASQSRRADMASESEDDWVDALKHRVAPLGARADDNALPAKALSSTDAGTSRASLSKDRRAAARARIEQRMAEKKVQRSQRQSEGYDKENIRPYET